MHKMQVLLNFSTVSTDKQKSTKKNSTRPNVHSTSFIGLHFKTKLKREKLKSKAKFFLFKVFFSIFLDLCNFSFMHG